MSRCSFAAVLRMSPRLMMTFSRAFSISSLLKTHYDTLKLDPKASVKEIKDAYFGLSKKYHPDLHPNDPSCADRFIKLQEAYKVLSNPESRKNYDATISRRTSYSYSSVRGHPRPYGHPDYTERDEWLRADQQRRESNFRQEFNGNEFNRFYSKPHNLTPEELERYFKQKEALGYQKYVYMLFGGMLVLAVLESMYSTYVQDHPRKVEREAHSTYRRYLNPYSDAYLHELERRQRVAEMEDARYRDRIMRSQKTTPEVSLDPKSV